MAPDEGQVFVCDGSDAWDDAQSLTAFLERRGLRVWLGWRDKGEIFHPADYFDARAEAARRCGAFVLLLSAEPADVRDLRDLTGLAHAHGKPIFPVLVSERAPLTEFAEVMGDRPWTSTYGPDAPVRMDMLADVLEDLLGDAGPPAAGEAAPPRLRVVESPADLPQEAADEPMPDTPPAVAAAPDFVEITPDAVVAEAAIAPLAEAEPALADEPEPLELEEVMVETVATPEDEQTRLLRAYVGPRADHYLRRWEGMAERGSGLSWNWPALLVPPLWLALRKHRLAALAVAAATLALLGVGLFLPVWGLLAIPAALVVALWVALRANRAYLRRAERAITWTQARALGPHATLARLQAKGGRDWPGSLLVALLLAGGALVLLAHAVPDRRICAGGECFETRLVAAPVREAVAPIEGAVAPTLASWLDWPAVPRAEGISREWIAGRWGVVGTGCGIWIDFNPDGTLVDNLGGTGRWQLETFGEGGDTAGLVISADRTGQTMPTEVERVGDTMVFGGNRTAWTRDGC